ncbi:MAG TPA: biopolymer transporter ExbD, partial [Gammaproteobacteria bacterium]|nr:biopolymer transporter ExbD [Gammaproteobacteria bacterium]
AALDEPLILSVDRAGAFYLNFGDDADEALDEQGLRERAAAAVRRNAATPIYVRGDEDATHGRVMRGFDLMRQAGAKQVVLMFDPPDDDNGR